MMKHFFVLMGLWIVLAILFFFVISTQNAPGWVVDLYIFNALSFFLIYLNQFIMSSKSGSND